jgi:hypothetical protein
VSSETKFIHCGIYRVSLITKEMPAKLRTFLEESVKTVDFFEACISNLRILQSVCEEMGSDHCQLLLHKGFRWLSGGKIHTHLNAR